MRSGKAVDADLHGQMQNVSEHVAKTNNLRLNQGLHLHESPSTDRIHPLVPVLAAVRVNYE